MNISKIFSKLFFSVRFFRNFRGEYHFGWRRNTSYYYFSSQNFSFYIVSSKSWQIKTAMLFFFEKLEKFLFYIFFRKQFSIIFLLFLILFLNDRSVVCMVSLRSAVYLRCISKLLKKGTVSHRVIRKILVYFVNSFMLYSCKYDIVAIPIWVSKFTRINWNWNWK